MCLSVAEFVKNAVTAEAWDIIVKDTIRRELKQARSKIRKALKKWDKLSFKGGSPLTDNCLAEFGTGSHTPCKRMEMRECRHACKYVPT